MFKSSNMANALAVPGWDYVDDYYETSFGHEPAEYAYYYGRNSHDATNSFNRKSGKANDDQLSSGYSFFGWYPPVAGWTGGGQHGSRSGGQYNSRSDSYGGYDGYGGGGGHKCCCNNNNNNLATIGALALGFLAINGQLQNIINAINGARRRRKRDTSNNETANGKMMTRFSFAKSPVTVRREMSLLFRISYQINNTPCLFQCFTSTKAPYT